MGVHYVIWGNPYRAERLPWRVLSFKMKINYWRITSIIIWSTICIILGLAFYVGHFLPSGPMYPVGWTCDTSLRSTEGECGPIYKEDLSKVDIPGWAKFIRKNNDNIPLILVGLLFAGMVASFEAKKS